MDVWEKIGDKKIKYVSTMDNVYIKSTGETVNDNDIWIEKLVDIKPFGDIDYYEDDYNGPDDRRSDFDSVFFDPDLDNSNVCIDLYYDSGAPEIDGCDEDNLGLFDGIDLNDDGDKTDWISIDESLSLGDGLMWDDEMKTMMDYIPSNVPTVFCFGSCFSGGFIDDLSGPNRIICTATTDDNNGYSFNFPRLFMSALHGYEFGTIEKTHADADYNGDGKTSILEAFNFAFENDKLCPELEIPQYDDYSNIGSCTFLGDKNSAPGQPDKPSGSTNIKPGEETKYITSSSDPEGDIIYYLFDWGDGTQSDWLGPYNSANECEANHAWDNEGNYGIKVKARDDKGKESDWSESLTISITKVRSRKIFLSIFILFEKLRYFLSKIL